MIVSKLLNKIWPRRLRSQLILGIALINILLMSLFVMVMMNRQKDFFLKLNHDRAFAISTNFTNAASQHVLSYELIGLQKLVSTYKNVPGLEYAFITADDGTVLAHTNEKYLGQKATDSISAKLKPIKSTQTLLEDNSILDIATPIINNDQIIGWGRIGLSQKYIEPTLNRIKRSAFLYIFISIILGSIFAFIVANRLSKGLQKLMSAVKKIKAGNRKFRVGASRSFEIAELGTAFNRMLDNISANEKLLNMVLNNMPVGVWILDEKGKVISSNPEAIKIWGGPKYSGIEEQRVYKGWFTDTGKELTPADWGAAIVLAEGRSVINQEVEIECFDKSRKIMLNSAIPLHDDDQKLVGVITINVDITEQKNAEVVLKDSEEKRRLMINSALDAIISIDAEGKVTSWNPQAEKVFGWTEEEILDKTLSDTIIPARYKEAHDRGMKHYLGSGEHKVLNKLIELTAVNKNNDEFPVELNIVPIVQGQSTFFTAFIRDISERKKAQTAIKEQAETFAAIIENANESIWLLSPDLKVLQYNKTAKDRLLFNRGKEIYPGADFKEFLYHGTDKVFMPMFNNALAGKYAEQESYQTNFRGEPFWLRTKMYPVYDTHEKLIGVTILSENITDRKRSENELKESEEKFRNLVEETSVGVFILQNELVVYANPGFETISGYSQKELLNGMQFQNLLHPEDVHWVEKNYDLRISGKKPSDEYMARAITKKGDIIFVDIIVSRIIYNNQPAVIGSVIDKTRQIEEEKRIGRAVIEAQEKERTEIGMELHDNVKQIMAASLMSLDFVKQHIDNQEQSIEMINNVKGYIQEAITELRRLSHQLAPSVDENTGTLVEKIEKLISDSNLADKMEVHLDVQEFAAPISTEVQLAFYRILQEQFTNILKYSKATSVLILIKKIENRLYMIIKDDGIGFDVTLKKDGIGLENIKRRINSLNGQTEINSSVGQGCAVKVSVPFE